MATLKNTCAFSIIKAAANGNVTQPSVAFVYVNLISLLLGPQILPLHSTLTTNVVTHLLNIAKVSLFVLVKYYEIYTQ